MTRRFDQMTSGIADANEDAELYVVGTWDGKQTR